MSLLEAEVFNAFIWPRFPRPTSGNSFLTGSNYMRAFHGSERTNKGGMEPDGNELPLLITGGLAVGSELSDGPVFPARRSSCRW